MYFVIGTHQTNLLKYSVFYLNFTHIEFKYFKELF